MLSQKPRCGTAHQGLLGGGQYLTIANAEAHLSDHLKDPRRYWSNSTLNAYKSPFDLEWPHPSDGELLPQSIRRILWSPFQINGSECANRQLSLSSLDSCLFDDLMRVLLIGRRSNSRTYGVRPNYELNIPVAWRRLNTGKLARERGRQGQNF